MQSYDVIVCGSGPAGATAATLLSRRGLNVLVLDRKKFPRFKLCGGLLTWKTQRFLSRVLDIDSRELETSGVLRGSFSKWGLGVNDLPLICGDMPHPFLLVDRRDYDALLVDKMRQSGARLRSPEIVVDVEPHAGIVVLKSGERIKAGSIIGADGAMSTVRRRLAGRGAVSPPFSSRAAFALEVYVPRRAGSFADFPCINIGKVPSGYFWSFPGKEKQCLGVGSSTVRNGQKLKNLFAAYCRSFGVDISGSNVRGHPLPYGDFEVRPGSGNILLCGDAAGLADPLLGEGIFYAHYSALLACRAILDSGIRSGKVAETYAHFMQEIVQELRYARLWRNMTLGVLRPFNFALFRLLVRRYSRELVETIHGMRSFKCLRPREWTALND
jgi:geranylgeranyl reductase family protein